MAADQALLGNEPAVDGSALDGTGAISAPLRRVALRHRRVSLGLAALLMALYLSFLVLVAYARATLGLLVLPGASLGLLLGAGMIVVSWLLACVYVVWANRFHDAACDRLA